MKHGVVAALLMLLCFSLCSCGGSGADPTPAPSGQLLFAVYMVGSDLESRNNCGTNDLMDIVRGYQGLSGAERNDLELLVAFGGSGKGTWNGVRYADAACLEQDSADGVFGNAACYSYTALKDTGTAADMSDKNTLIHFLRTVQHRSPGYATVFLDFWDHGESYRGFGNDENFSLRSLSTTAMAEAFETTGFRPQIIGFDACLMGSAEVAAKLYRHADYLVVSENVEPPHGWDYARLLSDYGSSTTARELATAVVDGYIDSPAHAATSRKTLAVVDTAAFAVFLEHFDGLSARLASAVPADFATLVTAVADTGKVNSYVAMDLLGFLNVTRENLPELADAIDPVIDALSAAVVYYRQDGSVPHMQGLSVYGMDGLPWRENWYTAENSVSDAWYAFVEALITHDDADVTSPVVTPLAASLCGKEPEDGTCYGIADDYAVARADGILALETGSPDTLAIVTTQPLVRTSDGHYFLKKAAAKVLRVCSGADFCFEADTVLDADAGAFSFKASIQRQMVSVTAEFDAGIFARYGITAAYVPGQTLTPKVKGTIDPGELVVSFRQTLYLNRGKWIHADSKYASGVHVFTHPPAFSLVDANPAAQPYLLVRDAEGNISLYDTSGAVSVQMPVSRDSHGGTRG